jgi:hypothetical protein
MVFSVRTVDKGIITFRRSILGVRRIAVADGEELMTHNFRQHAQHIVNEFSGFIDDAAREAVGEENLGQLMMLIESAITTTVLEEMERMSDQVIALGNQMKKNAEHFDN